MELIHGAQALALGFCDAGMTAAAAFPGSPSTALASALEQHAGFALRWSSNENAVMSFAFGRAMAGEGALAIMKHVGVNWAHDALESMAVVHGLAAPCVLVEGQDARPVTSQNAQDNRVVWGGSVDTLVLTPTTVAECHAAAITACAISRCFGMPVVVRGDARTFKAKGPMPQRLGAPLGPSAWSAWPERGIPLATTAGTYALHRTHRERVVAALAPWIESWTQTWSGPGDTAVIVAAHLGSETAHQVARLGLPGLRLRTEHPLPARSMLELARTHARIVVLEECLPWLETHVRALVQREGLRVEIVGRRALGDERPVGWLERDIVERLLLPFVGARERLPITDDPTAFAIDLRDTHTLAQQLQQEYAEHLAAHPPRGFVASDVRGDVLRELRNLGAPRPTFVVSDPGITGVFALGHGLADAKMHMGGAVPIACGWSRARSEGLAIAVVGDTNLFHSEWMGIVEACAAKDDVLVVIVDNGCSEMTARLVPLRPSVERSLESFACLGATVRHARVSRGRSDFIEVLRELGPLRGVRVAWLDVEPH